MSLEEILDVLEQQRHPGVTMHPDDNWMRTRNDLLDDLIEDFRAQFSA